MKFFHWCIKCVCCLLPTLIVVGCAWAVLFIIGWYATYGEIDESQYACVHEWAEEFPEIKIMVEDASWEDDTIDKSEFKDISEAAEPFLKEKRDAVEIPEYKYEEIRDWVRNLSILKPTVDSFLKNDGKISKSEYTKIWRMKRDLQKDQLIQEVSVPTETK